MFDNLLTLLQQFKIGKFNTIMIFNIILDRSAPSRTDFIDVKKLENCS